jgi:hypothetical protein
MASPDEPDIEDWFANLRPGEYRVTSPTDTTYNCIAWAVGSPDQWWEPSTNPRYYWPEGAPLDDKVESLVQALATRRFEVCEDSSHEAGFEKIAIYGDEDGAFSHAARQTPDGKWTSKVGPYQDIVHETLEALEGPEPAYGKVVVFMRRPTLPPAGPTHPV